MDNGQKAVQNQKVFVQLSNVLALQAKYLDIKNEFVASEAEHKQLQDTKFSEDASRKLHAIESRLSTLRARKQAVESVIKTLELPIPVPF